MKRKNKILSAIIAVCALAVILWFREPIWAFITNRPQSQRTITVVEGQGATVEFGDLIYGFGYLPADMTMEKKPILTIATKSLMTENYEIVEGMVINDFGVEVTVLEIHEDYIKIAVKQVVS